MSAIKHSSDYPVYLPDISFCSLFLEMGKGSKRRPRQISREEYALRWEYKDSEMTREKFERRLEKLKQKTSKEQENE